MSKNSEQLKSLGVFFDKAMQVLANTKVEIKSPIKDSYEYSKKTEKKNQSLFFQFQ